MMQNESIQPENYFCRKCYTETRATNPECPHCGKKMQTQSHVKSLGKVLVVLGIFIALVCGLGFLLVTALLLFKKMSDYDVAMGLAGLGWTGAGLAAGITAIIGGAWQKRHGRTSKLFVRTFLGLVMVMIFMGIILRP